MADRNASRARKRADAAKRKARAEAAKAEAKRLEAIRAEAILEDQAPAHQRAKLVGATPEAFKAAKAANLYGPVAPDFVREPVAHPDPKRGGYRRIDPVWLMHRHAPSMVTETHLAAARRWRDDYEIGEGAQIAGGRVEFVDGSTNAGIADERLDAMQRYREACDAIGPTLRTPLQWLVLHGAAVKQIAARLEMTQERAAGWLVGGLDRLADHYLPDRPLRAPVAAPAPFLVDAEIADIPQERLGRKKVAVG